MFLLSWSCADLLPFYHWAPPLFFPLFSPPPPPLLRHSDVEFCCSRTKKKRPKRGKSDSEDVFMGVCSDTRDLCQLSSLTLVVQESTIKFVFFWQSTNQIQRSGPVGGASRVTDSSKQVSQLKLPSSQESTEKTDLDFTSFEPEPKGLELSVSTFCPRLPQVTAPEASSIKKKSGKAKLKFHTDDFYHSNNREQLKSGPFFFGSNILDPPKLR